MRSLLTQVEELTALRFVLIVAVIGGVLSSMPALFFGNTGFAGSIFAALTVGAALELLWFGAAILLWWVAVRRRQYSVWSTALHLTLALTLSGVLELALSYVAASIATNGKFAMALIHGPLSASSAGIVLVLIRSPIWFIGAACLVSLGRFLLESDEPVAPRESARTDPEAVAQARLQLPE